MDFEIKDLINNFPKETNSQSRDIRAIPQGTSFASSLGSTIFFEGNGFNRVKISSANIIAVGDANNLAKVSDDRQCLSIGNRTCGNLVDARSFTNLGIDNMDKLATGQFSVSIGHNNLKNCQNMDSSINLGCCSLDNAQNVTSTVSIGPGSLSNYPNTVSDMVGIGFLNQYYLTAGNKNTCVGSGSLLLAEDDSLTTALGYASGLSQVGKGDFNTFLGAGSGGKQYFSGNNNTCIGFNTPPAATIINGVVNNSVSIGDNNVESFGFNSQKLIALDRQGKPYFKLNIGTKTYFMPLLEVLP